MKYMGSCHCQKVRFELEADPIERALSCNCSICQRKGTLLSFAQASQFKLLSGESDLKDYQFGKKNIHHLFCSNCGVTSFSKGVDQKGVEMRAVNVRCLEGIELGKLKIDYFNGKDF